MAAYVLIHGAGSDSWYWHLVVPELRARGHDVIAPDLPCDDDAAGLAEYTDVVIEAVGDRRDLTVVAQSLAGFIAPLVCARVGVELLILVAAMIPQPGESAGEWWTNTGFFEAKQKQEHRELTTPGDHFDPQYTFLHDLPPGVAAEAGAHARPQSDTPFQAPWPLDHWPDVPTRAVLCRNDRFFPAEFMRAIVNQRLGITPDEMDSGHLPALGHPNDLIGRLETYRSAQF